MRKPPSIVRLLTAALLLVGLPVAAQGQEPEAKLDRALRGARGAESQRVIIRTKPGARAAVREVLKKRGKAVQAEHPSIEALTVEVLGAELAALAARPDVESLALDAEVTTTGDSRHKANSRKPERQQKDRRGGNARGGRKDREADRREKSSKPLRQQDDDDDDDDGRGGFTPKSVTDVTSATLRATLGFGEYPIYGLNVGVAVIDSGIADLPAFDGRITTFYDFTGGGVLRTTPRDDYGHGTHVAGLIASSDANYLGVAPGARLIGLKVLDGKGKGRTSDVIRAIEFAVANRQLFGIHIINLSLGHPILAPASHDPLVQAVESAVRAGIVVVASAGNFGMNEDTGEVGYAGLTSPGNAPSAITVAAVDTKGTVSRADDEVTAYSSRGPTWYDGFAKPDVAAPGHSLISSADVRSFLYTNYPVLQRQKGRRRYIALSGTSMATATATGVVATMLEASFWGHPSSGARLTPNAVKALLQYTAIPTRATGSALLADGLTQGTGQVNAEGALRLAYHANAGAPVNANWIDRVDADLAPQSAIGGEVLDWSKHILWGGNILWGETVHANQPAWAENIVWGYAAFTGMPWAVTVHWSDNIVWSMADDNIVWAENVVWGKGLLRAASGDNIVWSMVSGGDNIVWSNLFDDNIVWGYFDDNIVWGYDDNIVWSMHGSLR